MGSGQVGSNNSVHYAFVHDDISNVPVVKGRDPINYDNIGMGSNNGKNHPGEFLVRLRYDRFIVAQAQLQPEPARIQALALGPNAQVFVNLRVPTTFPGRQNENQNLPLEIQIDW